MSCKTQNSWEAFMSDILLTPFGRPTTEELFYSNLDLKIFNVNQRWKINISSLYTTNFKICILQISYQSISKCYQILHRWLKLTASQLWRVGLHVLPLSTISQGLANELLNTILKSLLSWYGRALVGSFATIVEWSAFELYPTVLLAFTQWSENL